MADAIQCDGCARVARAGAARSWYRIRFVDGTESQPSAPWVALTGDYCSPECVGNAAHKKVQEDASFRAEMRSV